MSSRDTKRRGYLSCFRGTYTVLVTPFTADGAHIDVAALRRLVEFQITEGIHGLIPLGSTGEFLSLTRDERNEVIETVIDQARGRVPVLVGTGAEWTRDAVELSREAEALGADGVMVIPPFYSVPTEDELYVHYKAIGDAIGLPVMIYNNPATANVDMLPETVARLSAIPNVRYIKESTLDVTRVRDIVRLCGDRMTVFAGVLGYESFFLGAAGWVAVCSNVIPKLSAELFEAAVERNDPDRSAAHPRAHGRSPVVGRRPALRVRHQGRAGDHRPARRAAAAAAPAACRERCGRGSRRCSTIGLPANIA